MARAGKDGQGPLQRLRDAVETRVLPAFAAEGFFPDPALADHQGWNGQGYDWFLMRRLRPDILLRTHLWVGPSRDPALAARTEVFSLSDPEINDADAAAQIEGQRRDRTIKGPRPGWRFSDNRFPYQTLSPWRPWSAVGFGILNQYLYTDGMGLAEKLFRWVTFPVLFLASAVLVPVNLIAIPMSLRWSKSKAVRSGARQARIADRAARAVASIVPRVEKRLAREGW